MSHVSKQLKVPFNTLKLWFNEGGKQPPREVLETERETIIGLLDSEARSVLEAMKNKRDGADYKSMGVVLGILLDKLQLLEGKPTEIKEEIEQVDIDVSKLSTEQLELLAEIGAGDT
jgi:hypothetical protein